jgi:hypothetical protein
MKLEMRPGAAFGLSTIDRGMSHAESEHVVYEIEMFCHLAAYFESGEVDRAVQRLDQQGIVVRNAMIESFQIHARQLIDFLTQSLDIQPHKDDIRQSTFTARPWECPRPAALEDLRVRIHKRVAHLSVQRAAYTAAEQRVDTRVMREELGKIIEDFLDAADDAKVCPGFVARARAALAASVPGDHPRMFVEYAPEEFLATEWSAPRTTSGTYGGGTAIMPIDPQSPLDD